MPDKALADYQTDVQTVSFQIGGKRPRGFVFTTEKADFSDLSLHSELNFEGLQPKERMVILEVARQDAEFWAHLHKSSQPRYVSLIYYDSAFVFETFLNITFRHSINMKIHLSINKMNKFIIDRDEDHIAFSLQTSLTIFFIFSF